MVTYGLSKQTLCTYQMAVAHGFSWATAMTSLKALYEHNKVYHSHHVNCNHSNGICTNRRSVSK